MPSFSGSIHSNSPRDTGIQLYVREASLEDFTIWSKKESAERGLNRERGCMLSRIVENSITETCQCIANCYMRKSERKNYFLTKEESRTEGIERKRKERKRDRREEEGEGGEGAER